MSDRWCYWKDGQERGPIPATVLRDLARSGFLEPTDYIAREGSEKRLLAADLHGLFLTPAWHFAKDGVAHGPVSRRTLKHLADCLVLSPNDLVWTEEMSDWVPAGVVEGLFARKDDDYIAALDLFFCSECGELSARSDRCSFCGGTISATNRLTPGTAIGLIGLPATGKTCYLAALHDQLMHAAPEWRVQVSDRAFERLTDDFWSMCNGQIPAKTQQIYSTGFFSISIVYRGQVYPLVMNDMAGEYTRSISERIEREAAGDPDFCSVDPEVRSRNQNRIYFNYLRQCRAVLVAIPCWEMRAALEGIRHPRLNSYDDDREHIKEADAVLSNLFRKLTNVDHHVEHVEVVLIGVDIYGGDPEEACVRATESFDRAFRAFPGVLKNAGITVGSTSVSNIGFDNGLGVQDSGIHKILSTPRPFNALAPLRRILDRSSRESSDALRSKATESTSAYSLSRGASPGDPSRRKAFLSYRRDKGAETARLIRSSLETAGWDTFLDVDDLGGSFFDDRLLLEIRRADAFILILSPGSLDRCSEPDDWFRREIGYAVRWNKRIVPVSKDGFEFTTSVALPPDIAPLARINCVEYSHQYFQATFERLLQHLTNG